MSNLKTILFRAAPVIWTGLAVLFLLLIYGPSEQYFSNANDFCFDIYDLLIIFFPVFLLSTVFLSIFIIILVKYCNVLIDLLLVVLLSSFVAFYVQGTFFSKSLPIIDGHTIIWQEYLFMRIQSIMIWFSSFAVFFILFFSIKRNSFYSFSSFISKLCLSFMILSLLLIGVSRNGFAKKHDIVISNEGITQFSNDTNFTIVLLDEIDSNAFNELVSSHDAYRSAFKDFTYFKNTVCCYPFTAYSVPQILTGEKFLCQENYYRFLNRAYANSPLFNRLLEDKYTLKIFFPDLVRNYDSVKSFQNIIVNERRSKFLYPVNFAKTMFKLSGLKYFPYDLKTKCNVTAMSLYGDSQKDNFGHNVYSSNLLDFHSLVEDSKYTIDSNKCFSFVYLDGAHAPYETGADLSFNYNSTYTDELEASVKVTCDFINKMKDYRVYDNSIIVIMSDHGHSEKGNTERQNPLLLVKGLQESADFTLSDLPVSYDYLINAFYLLIEGNSAHDSFDFMKDFVPRPYFDCTSWNNVEKFTEYIQYGYADDLSTLQPTGTIYTFQ